MNLIKRNKEIYKRFKRGERQKVLAHEYGIGVRQIKRIIAAMKGLK